MNESLNPQSRIRMIFAGIPATSVFGSKSPLTRGPAQTTSPEPTATPTNIVQRAPILHPGTNSNRFGFARTCALIALPNRLSACQEGALHR